ncbi:MAG: hypothetical protein ACOYK9_02655 [Chlamydiia bacterium]
MQRIKKNLLYGISLLSAPLCCFGATWKNPTTIGTDAKWGATTLNSFRPLGIAINNEGYAIAGWRGQNDGFGRTFQIETLGTLGSYAVGGSSGRHVEVDINNTGSTALVMLSASNIVFGVGGSYLNGGIWPTVPSASGGALQFSAAASDTPKVQINDDGTILSAWRNSSGGQTIQASILLPGAAVPTLTPTTIYTATGTLDLANALPALSMSKVTGDASFYWSESGASPQTARAAIFNGYTWLVSPALDTQATDPRGMSFINDKGQAIAAWRATDGTDHSMRVSLFLNGTWTPNQSLSGADTNTVDAPQAGIDNEGRAVAVWNSPSTITLSQIKTAHYDGNSWTEESTLSSVGGWGPRLAVCRTTGKAVATWIFNEGSVSSIQAALFYNGSWTSPVNIVTAALGDISGPVVAINDDGNTVVGWRSQSTATVGSGNFYTMVSWLSAQAVNVTGQTINQRYLSGTNFIKRITWEPDPFQTVLTYQISRNGVNIGEVPGSGPYYFDDNNQKAGVTSTYSIVAVTRAGSGDAVEVNI